MKITKDSKAITLIALVITIIVLLILAGVALASLTGNSSIVDNANYAVTEYNKSAGNDKNVISEVENLFAKYMGEGGDNTTPTYTITYNANGGTGTMENQTASTIGNSTFTPPEGKVFKEWNTSSDGTGTGYAEGDSAIADVVLYAIWATPVTITYSANGGTGTMEATNGVRIAQNGFTAPAGKSFKGWNTAENPQAGIRYAVGEIVDTDLTLYPVWGEDYTATSVLSMGDIVYHNGEKFYVIEDSTANDTTVKLVASERIDENTLKQDCTVDGGRGFSTSAYWWDEDNNKLKDEYADLDLTKDSGSITAEEGLIKLVLYAAQEYAKALGVKAELGTIITLAQIRNLQENGYSNMVTFSDGEYKSLNTLGPNDYWYGTLAMDEERALWTICNI